MQKKEPDHVSITLGRDGLARLLLSASIGATLVTGILYLLEDSGSQVFELPVTEMGSLASVGLFAATGIRMLLVEKRVE